MIRKQPFSQSSTSKASSYSHRTDQRFGNESCPRSRSFKSQLTSRKPRISTISQTLIRKLRTIISLWELLAMMQIWQTSRAFCGKKISLMQLQYNRIDRDICLSRNLLHNHVWCLKDRICSMNKARRNCRKERTETGMNMNI